MGAKEKSEEKKVRLSDFEKDVKQEDGESDYEPARDSLSSQSNDEIKVTRTSRVAKKILKKESTVNNPRASKGISNRQDSSKLQVKTSSISQKRFQKASRAFSAPKAPNVRISNNLKVPPRPPSDNSEESDGKNIEEVKEIDVIDEAPICNNSAGTDVETVGTEENEVEEDNINAYKKIEEMEHKIEKLEEELREVAVLEISLYSIVPEHGSSAHKVHTPARRLSRLYIHACKHWTLDKKATIARNTVSGFVLIAKSCGNDVSRLTFWLSNTVVLREIISQTFGDLSNSNPVVRAVESNSIRNKIGGKSTPVKWSTSYYGNQTKRTSVMQQVDDWQQTSTFTSALKKIESWIFSRTVESVWWQTLTPHMQSPVEDFYSPRSLGKVLEPVFGAQKQGKYSTNLWENAFHDAFTRLCPLRSRGHECGCLPVLARTVMEQCISRLDVAMFNAILRESANEMPTDPVSDPIVDPKVLPVPAGDLSFGSGAQLKNSIGSWSRCLTEMFGLDAKMYKASSGDDDISAENGVSKSFRLLNELSDFLMLPKDMLLEKAIRKEVCPSIGLSLITRLLCNFTPDEFCPDPVPGIVLEELNAESLLERRLSEKDMIGSFPCSAAPVMYNPPSSADVAEKVAIASGKAILERKASIVQTKGYTSDDDLDDLDSPLTSIFNKTAPFEEKYRNQTESTKANVRYKLLREVWSE